ncbi:MAG: Rpn family recombination-promoting nuclease/putative transposase [Alkalinema sp. RU_4_3]|nr:Rpn family recombination-promoting nuclease/putative transposase [Alkalinema sp. RU_4_3]
MFDNTCRFLAEHFSADFASWLLGEAIELTELKPSKLSLNPIRTDALILLQSKDSILHIEFQLQPKDEIPFRMLDYRTRGHRKYPDKPMRQVVIYLQETDSDKVHVNHFSLERTHHEFEVIRLWEQPEEVFLRYPGLIPFAALSNTEDPEATLRQVAQRVEQIPDPEAQSNISAASAILAALRLDNDIIFSLLRRDIMQESTVYQAILAEGDARRQRKTVVRLLRRGLALDAIAEDLDLSIEEVKKIQLSESL